MSGENDFSISRHPRVRRLVAPRRRGRPRRPCTRSAGTCVEAAGESPPGRPGPAAGHVHGLVRRCGCSSRRSSSPTRTGSRSPSCAARLARAAVRRHRPGRPAGPARRSGAGRRRWAGRPVATRSRWLRRGSRSSRPSRGSTPRGGRTASSPARSCSARSSRRCAAGRGTSCSSAPLATAVAIASPVWNDNFGDPDYLLRVVVSWRPGRPWRSSSSRTRQRMALDRERFRLLAAAAELGHQQATVDEVERRVHELVVPAFADVCVIGDAPPADLARSATRRVITVALRARGRGVGTMTLAVGQATRRRFGPGDHALRAACSAAASRSRSTTPGCSPRSSRSRRGMTAALGSLAEAVTDPGRRRPARLRQRRGGARAGVRDARGAARHAAAGDRRRVRRHARGRHAAAARRAAGPARARRRGPRAGPRPGASTARRARSAGA